MYLACIRSGFCVKRKLLCDGDLQNFRLESRKIEPKHRSVRPLAWVAAMAVSMDGSSIRFDVFEANLRTGELRREGVKIALQEQPFQVLAVLLQHPGELVTRGELRHRVWPENTFVEFDYALNTAIKKIRAAVGDCALAPRYVETIPRRGYRFIAPVNDPTEGGLTPHITSSMSALTVRSRQPEREHAALTLLLPGILLLGMAVGYFIRGRD